MDGSTPSADDIDVSVIVPASNVGRYLPTCLASVRNQVDVGTQIIVVDDGSNDETPEIAREALGEHPRATVISHDAPRGPGEARNSGFELAEGRWTMFVDADDYLVPNTVADMVAIADRLTVDFLLFDHSQAMPSGETIRNVRSASIERFAGRCVTALEAPELLQVLPVVWNKLFDTNWLRSTGLRFPDGIYEDMVVTYGAFARAERIGTHGRSCYYYRRRPEADSELARIDTRHFDVLTQWDRVAADTDGRHAVIRGLLFDRMVDHAVYTLEQRVAQLSVDRFDEFFAELVDRYHRHRPVDSPNRPLKIGAVRTRMIERGDPRAYRATLRTGKVANRIRAAATSTTELGRRGTRGLRQRAEKARYRRMAATVAVDEELAVFSSSWNRYPGGNPAAIAAELGRRQPDIRRIWIVDDHHDADEARQRGFEVVAPGSRESLRALARARWLVNDVNFPNFVDNNPGQIHLQTKHGTPLKSMGLDLTSFPQSAGGMNFELLRTRAARWDYVISSNPYSSEIWRNVFPHDYEMLEVGYPRNDRLVGATPDAVTAARDRLGLGDEPIVLYAPTLRDYISDNPLRLDLARLVRQLAGDDGRPATILVRAHYLNGRFDRETPADRVIDVSADHDLESLMLAADVLVTDYSSIMFDYAVLGRPIVLYLDDWDEYQRSRGTYFDIRAEPPGPVVTTQAELAVAVNQCLTTTNVDERLTRFQARFCPWDDGQAAARVVEEVFER